MEITPFRMLCITAGDLLANAGIMRGAFSANEATYPEIAERFDDKLNTIIENLQQEIAEIQEFGSAFDDVDE